MQERIRTFSPNVRWQSARHWFEHADRRTRRLVSAAMIVAIVALMAVAVVLPMTTTASYVDLLNNGSFEHGFYNQDGCGAVGSQWGCFTNGGAAGYGFYDDQWDKVVADGAHSQLIEINTKNFTAGDPDRYAGIFQTMRVVDREKYNFSMKGMIRTTNMEGDPWRYRVQFGWTRGPQADWNRVENWVDVGWDSYYERTAPRSFSHFETMLMPGAEIITVYVRVWKKWGVPFEELDVNLDSIALVGPPPRMPHTGGPEQPMPKEGDGKPMGGDGHPMGGDGHPIGGDGHPMDGDGGMKEPQQPHQQPARPMSGGPLVCGGESLIYNGSFEHGFNQVALGDVGKSWGAFTNGGAANYGFYDDQWEKVVADGEHSQLIEINSKRLYPTDADRYAGIYQLVDGLHPGAIYELTLQGMLRGEGNEDDPYRFEAQWGFNPGPDNDWRSVENWKGMDLGPIYARTKPGAMAAYTVRFEAPSQKVMLFVRGWKKWAITDVEMDLNLDAIRLFSCWPEEGSRQPKPEPMHQPKPEAGHSACVVVIQRGDSLVRIARDNGVSVQALAEANGIKNPSVIIAGQKLQIPGCQAGGPAQGQQPQPKMSEADQPMAMPQNQPQPQKPDQPMGHGAADQKPGGMPGGMSGGKPEQANAHTYQVKAGDSLGAIAARHDSSVQALAAANNIANVNIIYVGQILQIP